MLDPGYILLILTTLAIATAMAAYAPGVRKGPGRPLLHIARPAVYASAAGLLGLAGYLWFLILSHRYEYSYVYRYSSNDMPLRYVITSFWGGQEGTFLLWAVYGGLLALFLRFKSKNYEAPVLFFYMGIDLFLMLMLLKANPFAKLATVPPDGNGLNPLLQDPWMTIHPPIMFFGFASLGIPAAYAMAALVKEDWDNWVRRAIPWTIFGIAALGTGLTLGGYWAYSILGWGGFWGWDPVENSSLVPWLFAVALLHNQVIQISRGIFRRLNLFLALMPFVLLTYSTFLTRSGVLADFSVHSFTDLGINQFLAAFMGVFLGGGLFLFVWKFRRIPTDKAQAPLISREYFMFLGALVFTLFGIFVALGTSAPLITRIWGPASNVQPEFYNRMGLPFAIVISLLVAVGPSLLWRKVEAGKTFRRLLVPFMIALVALPAFYLAGVRHLPHTVLLACALFAVGANAMTVWRIMSKNWSAAGGYMAHVGIGLALLGIVTSTSYGTKSTIVMPKGDEVQAIGYGFKFLGSREVEQGKKNAYDVALRTAQGAYIMSPTMYFSDFNAGMMKKPAIHSFLARDVYISPIGYAVDPLDDRLMTQVDVEKGKAVPFDGMTLEFKGIKMESVVAADHDHPVQEAVAEVAVTRDGKTETLFPALKMFDKDQTESEPAAITGTDRSVALLNADMTGTKAQLGVKRPALGLLRGESGTIEGATVTMNGFDVVQPKRQGGTVKVFADAHVDMGGEGYDVRPGLVSRPGTEELERVEAPVGRTGLNLVLDRIDSTPGRAYFQLTGTPQEYLYAEVSLKPFIILLWMGTGLTVLGLAMATLHRARIAGRMHAAESGTERLELKKNGKRVAA